MKNFPASATYNEIRKYLACFDSISKLTLKSGNANKQAAVVTYFNKKHAEAVQEKVFLNFGNSMVMVEKYVPG